MSAIPPRLGVGCSAFPSAAALVAGLVDLVDYVEVGPDTLCREVHGTAAPGGVGRRSMRFVGPLLDELLEATAAVPLAVHGVELSIGSWSGWNEAYLEVLDELARRRPFPWHSEHLGFLNAGPAHAPRHAGVPLPLPWTRAAVELVAPRARALAARHGVPFLLENAAVYLPHLPADPGWDEATLLTEVAEASDCGLLLDLFNLWTNVVNHGGDVLAALERLPLERVVEIHVAGGDEVDGFLLDSHSGAVPEEVWDLLGWTLERAPNVAGVTFELLESHLPRFGPERIRAELIRLRATWDAHRAVAP